MRYFVFLILLTSLIACSVFTRKPYIVYENNLPSLDTISEPILIKTRIVVEQKNGKAVRDLVQIIKDLWYVEYVYSGIRIKPVVVSFAMTDADLVTMDDYLVRDAEANPYTMNIYYTNKRIDSNGKLAGISSFPWEKINSGILLVAPLIGESTLAHEVGHYFGLLHTFSEDYVSDTPSPSEFDSIYAYYPNIMNYHVLGVDFATKGQMKRMLYYVNNHRKNVIIRTDPVDNTTVKDEAGQF